MRRTAITGAIVLAISTTAVVALAGTAPSMDAPDRVPTTVQGQQFDTPVVQNMERTQTVSTVWTRDGIAHDQDMIWDRDQDMDTTHNQDMIWDRDQDM
ncbi:MAG: hypothetical protein M3132_13630, partial [Actinomycetia bacterium]|nr:hypothetical protein [Actinomycetes bacterium]